MLCGRFFQTDPIGYADGMNWYSYCANNPLNYFDPSGMYLDSYDWSGLTSNIAGWRENFQPDEDLRFTLSIPLEYVFDYDTRFDDAWFEANCTAEVETFLSQTGFFAYDAFKDMMLLSVEYTGSHYKVIIADSCDVDQDLNINLGTLGETDTLSIARHLVGPTLVGLGWKFKYFKPYGTLGSKRGSSAASWGLRRILRKKQWGFGIKMFGTRSIGGSLGRAVPIIGWALIGEDILASIYGRPEPGDPAFFPGMPQGTFPFRPRPNHPRCTCPDIPCPKHGYLM